MSIRNICLNCGAEKSPGHEYACVSCGSKFEDQEMQYKTEQEKRNRFRELTMLKKKEREKDLKSEESKRADLARTKSSTGGIGLIWIFKNLDNIILLVISIIGIITLFLFNLVFGILGLIITVILVAVYIFNKRNKKEER